MNQVVGSRGLRVVRQKLCSTLEEAISFAKDDLNLPSSRVNDRKESTYPPKRRNKDQHLGLLGKGSNVPVPTELSNDDCKDPSSTLSSYCVVKPCRGVASDDVFFCKNTNDVKKAFEKIHRTPVFGSSEGLKHESVVRSNMSW